MEFQQQHSARKPPEKGVARQPSRGDRLHPTIPKVAAPAVLGSAEQTTQVAALAGVLAGLWRRASRPNPRGWSTGFIASDGFLDTREWARARYEALRANDGRCELCGRGRHDGARL